MFRAKKSFRLGWAAIGRRLAIWHALKSNSPPAHFVKGAGGEMVLGEEWD